MKNSWIWLLLGVSSLAWLIFVPLCAPMMSGTDVFIFRDAGWNLAASGSFVSSGLIYMPDLNPHFYSHYTPLMPLLFACFLSIFPKCAYAGTIFNDLIGIALAAISLLWVLRQPASWLRTAAAILIALFPILFASPDRPESLALILFAVTVGVAHKQASTPILLGLLLALTFLIHPFAAICAAMWAVAVLFVKGYMQDGWLSRVLGQIVGMGMVAAISLTVVAAIYYWIDPTSLARFGQHAFGMHSGLGVAMNAKSKTSFVAALHKGVLGSGSLTTLTYGMIALACVLLAGWLTLKWKSLDVGELVVAAAGLCCLAMSILAFPAQYNYVLFLGIAIPLGLWITCQPASRQGTVALGMILFFVLGQLPALGTGKIQEYEEGDSYRAAANQPAVLSAYLHSPNAIVGVSTGNYDVFKPSFNHLVNLEYLDGNPRLSDLSGLSVCYMAASGNSDALAPIPSYLDASSFTLIQRAPRHLWITLFGHRLMSKQWGYGCDLYVRNTPLTNSLIHRR